VGGLSVAVGTAVAVGGISVAVGKGVAVGGIGVAVGVAVAVGGIGDGISVNRLGAATVCGEATGVGNAAITVAAIARAAG